MGGADRGANTTKTPSGADPPLERLDQVEPDLIRSTVSTMVAILAEKGLPTLRAKWRKGYKRSHEAVVACPFPSITT
jgi:hypothetical protein